MTLETAANRLAAREILKRIRIRVNESDGDVVKCALRRAF
jgi:hypothetical protein